jgi:anhydro-N-acetylmuramic acid kinase
MESKIALGMMSGTSIDGSVSTAIIETDGADYVKRLFTGEYRYEDSTGPRPIHHFSKAAEQAYRFALGNHSLAETVFPEAIREYFKRTFALTSDAEVDLELEKLSALFFRGDARPVTLKDVIDTSTNLHFLAAQTALLESGTNSADVSAVGFHGQTLYHDPFVQRVTVQVGDAQALADQLGIPVVFDFRTKDVQHGGQGAPLAPSYHRALMKSSGVQSAALLNLGGTANVTVIDATNDLMIGFDTGPANGLIDRYVKEKLGLALDLDSGLALRGRVADSVVEALLNRAILLKDGRNFLAIKPPKSLDIRDYTFDIPEFLDLSVEDGCATLNAFTAECVARSIDWIEDAGFSVPTTWVLCGGGAYSPHLRQQLFERISRRIGRSIILMSADAMGWSAQGMEAELFAYLAVRSIRGLPITFPGTTGVSEPLPGGQLFVPTDSTGDKETA